MYYTAAQAEAVYKHETDGVALCNRAACCLHERSFCLLQKTFFFLVSIEVHRVADVVVLRGLNTAFMYSLEHCYEQCS